MCPSRPQRRKLTLSLKRDPRILALVHTDSSYLTVLVCTVLVCSLGTSLSFCRSELVLNVHTRMCIVLCVQVEQYSQRETSLDMSAGQNTFVSSVKSKFFTSD